MNIIRKMFHTCKDWEFRADPGEEEHGVNPFKRYCKGCGKEQHSFYHEYGDIRHEWRDVEKITELP